jgi:hypothetical protein
LWWWLMTLIHRRPWRRDGLHAPPVTIIVYYSVNRLFVCVYS